VVNPVLVHRKEVKLHEGKKYTRSTRKQSQSEQNKSATTDHVDTENHIAEATIIDRESDRTKRNPKTTYTETRWSSCSPMSTITYYSSRL